MPPSRLWDLIYDIIACDVKPIIGVFVKVGSLAVVLLIRVLGKYSDVGVIMPIYRVMYRVCHLKSVMK